MQNELVTEIFLPSFFMACSIAQWMLDIPCTPWSQVIHYMYKASGIIRKLLSSPSRKYVRENRSGKGVCHVFEKLCNFASIVSEYD